MARPIPKRIENEEQYLELSARMVQGAEMIDHPLTTPAKKAELLKVYDQMESVAMVWLRGDAGGPSEPENAPDDVSVPPEPETPTESPEEAPKVDVSGWLD